MANKKETIIGSLSSGSAFIVKDYPNSIFIVTGMFSEIGLHVVVQLTYGDRMNGISHMSEETKITPVSIEVSLSQEYK